MREERTVSNATHSSSYGTTGVIKSRLFFMFLAGHPFIIQFLFTGACYQATVTWNQPEPDIQHTKYHITCHTNDTCKVPRFCFVQIFGPRGAVLRGVIIFHLLTSLQVRPFVTIVTVQHKNMFITDISR